MIDNVPYAIFIDRKLKEGYSYPKIHVVNYQFADELFQKDTLFTGELVRDINRNWLFLMSDILIYKGQTTRQKNVLSRFQLIYDILEKQFTPDTVSDICPIQVKRLFQYSDIKAVFTEFMPSLSYVCKGIVFYTLNNQFSNYAWTLPKEDQIEVKRKHEADEEFLSKYPDYAELMKSLTLPIIDADAVDSPDAALTSLSSGPGEYTATSSVRWNESSSPNSKDTAHLYIVKTEIPDIYNLYTRDNQLTRNSVAFIPDLKTSRMLYTFFSTTAQTQISNIATCQYHAYFKRWIPVAIYEQTQNGQVPATEEELKNQMAALDASYTGPTIESD
jgi:hypothetical protein